MPDAPDALRRRRCPVQTLNDAARLALVIALVGAAALVGAWIFQYGFGILPCPLCLQQRYAYYLIIPLAFILARVIAPPDRPLWGSGTAPKVRTMRDTAVAGGNQAVTTGQACYPHILSMTGDRTAASATSRVPTRNIETH